MEGKGTKILIQLEKDGRGTEYTLSLEEAREMYQVLKGIFEKQETFWVYPTYPIFPEITYPEYPYPNISWGGSILGDWSNADISFEGNSMSASITGLTPDYSSVRNEEVSVGRFISQDDIDTHATVVVIGEDIVTELFDSNTHALGSKLRIGNNLYQVVGVLESKGGTAMGSSDNQVFVPISTAQSRLITRSSAHEEVNLISVSAINSEVMDDAMSEITNILSNRHHITGDEENDLMFFHRKCLQRQLIQLLVY